MLLPADAELVDRDVALPGLGVALDPSRIAEGISSALGRCVADCRVSYVRYKPGTSCLVGGSVAAGGRRHPLHVTAYRPHDAGKRHKALRAAAAESSLGPGAVELGEHCLATFFPNDATLRALWKLDSAVTRPGVLSRVFRDAPQFGASTCQVLAYKPERRAVLRLDLEGRPVAVLKLYGPDRFAAARRQARLVRSGPALRVPRRVGKSASNRAVAVEWIDGNDLSHSIARADGPSVPALRAAGAALCALHGQAAAGATATSPLPAAVTATARTIAMLHPPSAGQAARLAEGLVAGLRDQRSPDALVHGDFYARQVLEREGPFGIVDLDDLCAGEVEQDLGNFVAHLDLDVERGRIERPAAHAAGAALLDGYRRAGGVIAHDRLRVHRAVGLFRLATRPFRDRWDDWPRAIDRFVESAAAAMESPVGARA